MSDRIVQVNQAALSRCGERIENAGRQAIENLVCRMRAAAEEYRSRVAAAVPVRSGGLRDSWQVAENITPQAIEFTLGTNQTSRDGALYPVYLELGSDHIAGGRVKDWQPGEEPISDWPAQLGGAGSERPAPVVQAAFSAEQPAQMPFLRPIGAQIADELLSEIPRAVAEGFQSAGP